MDERRGDPAPGQDQTHDLQRLGEPKSALLVEAQGPRRIAIEILRQVARGLLETPHLGRDDLAVVPASLTQAPHHGRGAIRAVASRMQDQGHEQLVDPEPAAGHPSVIGDRKSVV